MAAGLQHDYSLVSKVGIWYINRHDERFLDINGRVVAIGQECIVMWVRAFKRHSVEVWHGGGGFAVRGAKECRVGTVIYNEDRMC